MAKTMTTDQFASLPKAKRSKLVDQGWDILRFEKGPWRRTSQMDKKGTSGQLISEIVKATRDTSGDYLVGGKWRSYSIPKGTEMRLTKFAKTTASGRYKGREVQVRRKAFKVIRKEYRTSEAIWGKKTRR